LDFATDISVAEHHAKGSAMPIAISDIDSREISTCKKGKVPAANRLILKAADDDENVPDGHESIQITALIKAVDKPKQQIFARVLVADVADADDHIVSPEEVEKAAHRFMMNMVTGRVKGMGIGANHSDFSKMDYPIESVFDSTGTIQAVKGFPKEDCFKNSWVIGIQLCDDSWQKVMSREIEAVSLGGSAMHEPLAKDAGHASFVDRFRDVARATFDKLTKEEGPKSFDDAFQDRQNRDRLWQAIDALIETVVSIFYSAIDVKDKKTKIKDSLKGFQDAVYPLLNIIKSDQSDTAGDGPTAIQDINKQDTHGGSDMDSEEVRKIVKAVLEEERAGEKAASLGEKLEKIDQRLQKLEEPETDAGGTDEKQALSKEELGKIPGLLEKIEKGLGGLTKRIEKLEQKPRPRNGDSPEGEGEPVQKSAASRTVFNVLGIPDSPSPK